MFWRDFMESKGEFMYNIRKWDKLDDSRYRFRLKIALARFYT